MSAPILLINSIIHEHECKILFDTKVHVLRDHIFVCKAEAFAT